MKLIKLLLPCLLCVAVFSCTGIKKEEDVKDAYLRYTKRIVEDYENPENNENITYQYLYDNDFFWKKAVYRDSEGKVTKVVEREFDEDKLPIREYVRENGILTESYVTKYCLKDYELLSKTEYEGEILDVNKVRTTIFYYDNKGWLISEEVTSYSNDPNYINVDGNKITDTYTLRFFPTPGTRPKGSFIADYFVEKRKRYFSSIEPDSVYKRGDLIFSEETKFDEAGFPEYFKSSDPECEEHSPEEWYSYELDSLGRIVSLTGYSREKYDSLSNKNSQITYHYNNKGSVIRIEEYKYNTETNKFDRFHNLKTFKWYKPNFISSRCYVDASVYNEHYCFTAKRHFISETKIVKYDDFGEKIIDSYFGDYKGDYGSQKIKTKLVSKIKEQYDLYEKRAHSGILKKNKKYR